MLWWSFSSLIIKFSLKQEKWPAWKRNGSSISLSLSLTHTHKHTQTHSLSQPQQQVRTFGPNVLSKLPPTPLTYRDVAWVEVRPFLFFSLSLSSTTDHSHSFKAKEIIHVCACACVCAWVCAYACVCVRMCVWHAQIQLPRTNQDWNPEFGFGLNFDFKVEGHRRNLFCVSARFLSSLLLSFSVFFALGRIFFRLSWPLL